MLFSLPNLIMRINEVKVEEVNAAFLRLRGHSVEIGFSLSGVEFSYLEARELPPDPLGAAPRFDKCLRLSLPNGLVLALMSSP